MEMKRLGNAETSRHIYKVAAVKDGRREYIRVYSRNKVNARRLVVKAGYDVADVELLA